MCLSQTIQIVNVFLIGATVVLLFFYTKQTYLLRKATVAQNELMLRPSIIALSGNNGIRLKNIGNGSAINIYIEEIEVSGISIPELGFNNEKMLLRIDVSEIFVEPHKELKFVFSGSSENAKFNKFIKDKSIEYFGFPFFKFGVKEYNLRIHYEDILHQPYISDITVNCKKRRIRLIDSYKAKN